MTRTSQLRGRQWRVLSAKFRARCQAENARCWQCGQDIDYTAKPQTPGAFEIFAHNTRFLHVVGRPGPE